MFDRRLDSIALRLARPLARLAPGLAAAGLARSGFLVGCGRSGSGLLRRLLSRHPDLAVYPSEANELWHPRLYPWTATDRTAPPLWLDPEGFTGESLARATDADHRRRRALFGAFRRLRGGRCFVNKTEMIHFMLPEVASWHPDARFLHLVRDGRAVCLSRARRLTARADEAPGLPNRRSFDELLDESARYWLQSILAVETTATELAAAGRFLEVSYEELCADPRRVLAGVATFLGVDGEAFRDLDPDECSDCNYKFRSQLDPATVGRLTELMSPALELKGYAPPGDRHSRSPNDPPTAPAGGQNGATGGGL